MEEEQKILEHNIHGLLLQKQSFQSQLIEVESALEEIGKAKQAYKIVGNIMVSTDSKALTEELKQKQEMLKIRITNLEKQEAKLKAKVEKHS